MAQRPVSFDGLRRHVDQLASQSRDEASFAAPLADYIPPSFTWQDLASELAQLDQVTNPLRVRALRACLDAEPSRLVDGDDDGDKEAARAARRRIGLFVARAMAPIVADADADVDADADPAEDEQEQRRAAVIQRCRWVAADALAVLQRVVVVDDDLLFSTDSSDDDDTAQLLLSVIAAADAGQPWTTDGAAAAAQRLLAAWLARDAEAVSPWMVERVLKGYLRRLFARTRRPAGLTASGRPAPYGSGTAGTTAGDDTETARAKPWKHADLRAVSVFAWVLRQAETDGSWLGTQWPLCTPVLLTLLDDGDAALRRRGLTLVPTFVAGLPSAAALLGRTGLDRVLADAVFPTLLFLPRLTPEAESVALLEAAYGALLALAAAVQTTTTSSPPAALLDRILREGVFPGYFHAHEYPRVVEVLARQSGRVVEAMGLHAVKHLRELLPMYAAILTDPFALQYRPTVAAAIGALQTTIASCWPRLAATPWQGEITKMVVLCWLNVQDEDAHDADQTLQDSLVRTADMLLAVMKAADVDLAATIEPLVAKEPRLADLFRRESIR